MSDFTEMTSRARSNSVAHGFASHGIAVRETGDAAALEDYWSSRIMLIVGEVAEAHEELRKGHAMTETYLSYKPVPASLAVEFASGAEATEAWQATQTPKPEGVPSELADIVIRVMDLALEAGIDLEAAVKEKMAYNETREMLHGKRF